MRVFLLSLLALALSNLNVFSQNHTTKKMNSTQKALVVYFSASGVTRAAAERLAKAADADLHEIVPETPYTDADLNWNDANSRSSKEMNPPTSRPAIKGKLANVDQYETIYIGFPIWWYTAPTIINTFIEQTDLKGKRLVVFATSGGSSSAKATEDLKKAYPALTFQDGGVLNSRSQADAEKLVKSVK